MPKTRVLLISHTCQSTVEGQPKAQLLARAPDIDLEVLVPHRWLHYGKWRTPETPASPPYRFTVGHASLPWVGPAQFYLHFYPALKKILKRFQPHVIDLWEEPWGLVSAHTAYLRKRHLPAAKIISETEQNLDKSLPFPFENFRRYTLRRADFAVGRNAESIDIIRRKGYTGPSAVVPNAVDTALFRPLDIAAARARFSVSGFALGYAGRLIDAKGLDDLLDALPLCPPDTTLYLAGDGPYEADLRKKISDLNLTHRVTFVGNLGAANLAFFLNALDAFVLPSRTTARWKEQFGRVIIEAQACKIPVIGSSSGAIPEVIADAGLIFKERTPADLAAQITRLHNNPAERAHLAEAGFERAHRCYRWQCVADTMAGIYHSLAHPEASAGSVTTASRPAQLVS